MCQKSARGGTIARGSSRKRRGRPRLSMGPLFLRADSDIEIEEELSAPRPRPVDFEAVYAEHFAFVWRNLRRLGVAEASLRDAAQDVFLVVHRRLGDFEGRGSVQSWLYSILRRVAAEHRRRRDRKELTQTQEADQVADPRESGPENRAAQGEALRLLLRLLDTLDPDKRDVLVLADLESMSVPEIAAALDCNINTVYARLRAARQAMREAFAKAAGRSP